MTMTLDEAYLTVAEAAARLRVNPSTIRRWIAKGSLPASRVGQRRVALKESDVAAMIAPIQGMRDVPTLTPPDERPYVPPLTPEERQRIEEFLERAERRLAEWREQPSGKPIPPSWVLLNEARDERTEQLG